MKRLSRRQTWMENYFSCCRRPLNVAARREQRPTPRSRGRFELLRAAERTALARGQYTRALFSISQQRQQDSRFALSALNLELELELETKSSLKVASLKKLRAAAAAAAKKMLARPRKSVSNAM